MPRCFRTLHGRKCSSSPSNSPAAPLEVAVGLVDVKNTWIEPAELVAQRLRQTLKYIEPERVHVTPDCGFSQTARYVAQKKLASMVEGVKIVRRELSPLAA
jgi:5-methyltetrahydropteroyltriglutamate--homocysteine methyltransferase